MAPNQVLGAAELDRIIRRMAHEIAERNGGAYGLILVGIRTRGLPLARRLADFLRRVEGVEVPLGELDITLYRDDLSTIGPTPHVGPSKVPDDLDDRVVLLVDDVLFTGRTVRAALDALMDFGRPRRIELAVLIDRGHRELPIRADYVGLTLPTTPEQIVHVHLQETDGRDDVVVTEEPLS